MNGSSKVQKIGQNIDSNVSGMLCLWSIPVERWTGQTRYYWYLGAGDALNGQFLHENDDSASGGVNLNSRIASTLPAGNYTIEATTDSPEVTSIFSPCMLLDNAVTL